MTEFIVAEITANWSKGKLFDPAAGLISQRFERVIETNLRRGYALHSFQLNRLLTGPESLDETIVAVFQKILGV
jgi:hypothetical protein